MQRTAVLMMMMFVCVSHVLGQSDLSFETDLSDAVAGERSEGKLTFEWGDDGGLTRIVFLQLLDRWYRWMTYRRRRLMQFALVQETPLTRGR